MNNLLSKIILISLLTLSFNNVFSQIETNSIKQEQVFIIKMKNGDEYKGTISKKDNKIIVLKTVNGTLNLVASNVSKIEKYNYKGKFAFPNPHDTRYFFGPSAISIKKGKGYYQNVLVTSNFVNYGITENISIGGGFEILTLLNGSPIWFLTPKAGYNISENINVGGGFIMLGLADKGTTTLAYGAFTLGHSETNLSIGVGYGLINDKISDSPAIMISGTHRISKIFALLSENYILPAFSQYFGIHGVRILSKRSAFDIGLFYIPGTGNAIGTIPYIGYALAF